MFIQEQAEQKSRKIKHFLGADSTEILEIWAFLGADTTKVLENQAF